MFIFDEVWYRGVLFFTRGDIPPFHYMLRPVMERFSSCDELCSYVRIWTLCRFVANLLKEYAGEDTGPSGARGRRRGIPTSSSR